MSKYAGRGATVIKDCITVGKACVIECWDADAKKYKVLFGSCYSGWYKRNELKIDAKQPVWFKDSPGGIQLHAGDYKGKQVFNSDDGGKTWWCSRFFSKVTAAQLTAAQLRKLGASLVTDAKEYDGGKI